MPKNARSSEGLLSGSRKWSSAGIRREAEVIKHLVFFILEVSLANTTEELMQVNPNVPPPPNLSSEQIEAVDNFWNDYQMAYMTVVTEKALGFWPILHWR